MDEHFKKSIEEVYEAPLQAPWTNKNPPEILVSLIEDKMIKKGEVLDVGCGEGFYSIYLAKKGFSVTGIDISEKAIKLAKKNAKKAKVKVKFKSLNLLDLKNLGGKFDFILEWAVLHHVEPKKRKKYVREVFNKLKKHGRYLSVSFNEQLKGFGEPSQKIRIVPENSRGLQGTKLYTSSLNEMQDLFRPYFNMLDSKVIKYPDFLNYLFMEKK